MQRGISRIAADIALTSACTYPATAGFARFAGKVIRGVRRPNCVALITHMALGSVLGAWVGSQLLPHAPLPCCKCFLVLRAAKMARSKLHGRARNDG